MLNKKIEIFIIYISSLALKIIAYLAKEVEIVLLFAKEVIVPAEYLNFFDVFLDKSVNVFSEQIGANEHAIKLE